MIVHGEYQRNKQVCKEKEIPSGIEARSQNAYSKMNFNLFSENLFHENLFNRLAIKSLGLHNFIYFAILSKEFNSLHCN
jgi:hypothetical protein